MANEYGLFFNSVDGDRVYDADSFAEWLAPFFTNGVFLNSFTPAANGGMNITLSNGIGYIDGKLRTFTQPTNIELAPASGTNPRIDTIVVERNDTKREITIHAVTGSYSGNNPSAPVPARENNIYQLVICQVKVPAGATAIKASDITDTRANKSVCGYVSNVIESPDFAAWYELNETQFNEWFATVKSTLGSDTAGNLLNQIEAVNNRIDNLSSDSVKMSDANETNDSIKFGIDANGNYGYIMQGSEDVIPFRHPTGNATAADVTSGKTFSTAAEEDAVGTLDNYRSVQELSDSLSKAWHYVGVSNYISVYLNDPSKYGGKLWDGTHPVRFDSNAELKLSADQTALNNEGLYTAAQRTAYGTERYNAGVTAGKSATSHVYGDDITVEVKKANKKTSGSASKTVTVPSGAKLWANLFPSIIQVYGNTHYRYAITTNVSYSQSGTNLTINLSASGSNEAESVARVVVRLYYIS